MKIISNFHDYYDNEAFVYGPDPLLVYDRKVKEQVFPLSEYTDVFQLESVPFIQRYSISYVSILGYGFAIGNKFIEPKWDKNNVLIRKGTNTHKVLHKNSGKFYNEFLELVLDNVKAKTFFKIAEFEDQFIGVYSEDQFALHQTLNTPIFSYRVSHKKEYITIEDGVPCLTRLGFEPVLDSLSLYNNLQEFFADQLEENRVEATLSEKDKIKSKGFDPIVSFKHRPKQGVLF